LRSKHDVFSDFNRGFICYLAKGEAMINPSVSLYCHNIVHRESAPKNQMFNYALKFPSQNERKILKVFLLGRLHQLFCEIFHNKIQQYKTNSSMECYSMDSKIIQMLIEGIIETGEYTLEGIAHATRIPFDVIFDAASGASNQFSITPWARVVNLYTQVKPEIAQLVFNKLLETKDKNHLALSLLLNEP
jgi:hypothetical protein